MRKEQQDVLVTGCVLCLCCMMWTGAAYAGTVRYTYDARNQVTRAVYDTGMVVDYDYDGMGNRIRHRRRTGTTLCGESISGTLTAAGGPYIVTCDLAVPSGSSLVIESGTELVGLEWYSFTIYGALTWTP